MEKLDRATRTAPRWIIGCVGLVVTLFFAQTAVAEGPPPAPQDGYLALRIVKVKPSDPSTPEITLPEGYEQLANDDKFTYSEASRAEYRTVIKGPSSEKIDVAIDWPGESIAEIVTFKERLPIRRTANKPGTASITAPIQASSLTAVRGTFEFWTLPPTDPGTFLRVEHNDPSRVTADYADKPWVKGEARAVINQLFAAQAILRDSGLAAKAAERRHFYALMGFETSNGLHRDWPAHWHLAYYQGETFGAKSYLPHLHLDGQGRNIKNGINVSGEGRTQYLVGQPAALMDQDKQTVAVLTIRPDGGLDIQAGVDGKIYSIVPGANDSLVEAVNVLRDGQPWLRIAATDRPKSGILTLNSTVLATKAKTTTIYRYDPSTGALKETTGPGAQSLKGARVHQKVIDRGPTPLD